MADISLTTQAILMLVAPLLTGGRTEAGLRLTPKEYTRWPNPPAIDSRPSDTAGKQGFGTPGPWQRFDRGRLITCCKGMQ